MTFLLNHKNTKFTRPVLRGILLVFTLFSIQSCCWFKECGEPLKPDPEPELPIFTKNPTIIDLQVNNLKEISGLAPSKNFKNALWLIEDSGTQPKIDLIGTDGSFIKRYPISAHNRDWEAVAIGPGPDDTKNYIYIGDIGDNLENYDEYAILRFEEPQGEQENIGFYETIKFYYPGNVSYDAETLLVDPKTKDIFIITKRQLNVKVFRLPYPQSTTTLTEAEFMGDIGYWGITTGSVSVSGEEILLKSYVSIFYWKRKDGETIFETLQRPYDLSPYYVVEPQGESICWDWEAKGFYTISERAEQREIPPLYYYYKE